MAYPQEQKSAKQVKLLIKHYVKALIRRETARAVHVLKSFPGFLIEAMAIAIVSVIDTTHEYTDPREGYSDTADNLLPFNMDGLDHKALSEVQRAEFSDLWARANTEHRTYITHKDVLYSIWTPSTTWPEYPKNSQKS